MSFQNPIAFIGLSSIAVIITMYLLKQKHKEIIIPSIMLWEKAYIMSLSQRPWQKLRRNLLMALQILLAALIVLVLSEPFIWRNTESTSNNIVLVLDASIGMQAVDEKPNRFEHAKSMIYDVIDSAPPGTEFAIISAAGQANIETNFTADIEYAKNVIKKIEVSNSSLSTESAKNLALALCGQEQTGTVYVFSGTGFEIGEAGINERFFPVGTETDNAGIILLSHITEPDRIVALVKIKNYGQNITTRSVALYHDDKLHDIKDIIIEPGDEKDVFFTQVPREVGRLTARLSEADANDLDFLPADDIAYSVVRDESSQKCLLVTDGNIFLEKALTLMPSVDLYKTESPESLGYYLYIYDGVLPETLPDGHILIINPPDGNSFFETAGDIEVDILYTERSRFINFLPEMDFAVSKAKQLTTPVWAERVLSADNTDLIFAGELDGRKIVVIGFDLHNSDLPLRKEFPIFIYNIIEWLVPGDIVASPQVNAGDEVIFTPYPNAKELRVASPDNLVSIVAPPFPAVGFTGTDKPGFYIVRQNSEESTLFSSFAVNPDSVDISLNIQPNVETVEASIGNVLGAQSLKSILIILCLLILMIEWKIYSYKSIAAERLR